MLQSETKPLALSWQELICRLDGVHAAKVVLGSDEAPEEIHILASTAKSPKALTRDVQSALMAVFGIEVDYRIISIAQIHSDLYSRIPRLCYLGIDVRYLDGQGNITVYLACGDSHFEGTACYTARNTASHLKGVALATLDGISKYVTTENNGHRHYEIISSEVVEIGGRPANIVTLCDDQGKHYIGSSFVREHHDDAVVRAVLDAVNRSISKYAVT
ncbi:MAG TPA: hypothetical protein VFC96_02560 [Anaerovoracaceae bacterium]|nr:hypothetical protein [Anaerovoracaceae bacterium]